MIRKNSISSFVLYLLLVSALLVGTGFFFQFYKNDKKMFSVSYGATMVGQSDVMLCEGEYSIFQLSQLLPSANVAYDLAIVPNENVANFDFVAGTDYYSFYDVDLSVAFFVFKYADCFVFYVPNDITMVSVLSDAVQKPVESELSSLDLSKTAYFSIRVSSGGETVVVNLKFIKRGFTYEV